SGLAVAAPSIANIALAQAQAGPKLTQILRKDLEGQGEGVQETVVSIVEFPPGAPAPWHMHPRAPEPLHVIQGHLTGEIEGKGSPAAKGGGRRDHPRRTGPSRAQRERERQRQGAGRPQPRCKGQTADRGREEITAGVEASEVAISAAPGDDADGSVSMTAGIMCLDSRRLPPHDREPRAGGSMSQTRFINPQALGRPPGYTHVVEVTAPGRIVYIAGQLGVDRDGKIGDFQRQAVQTFENLKTALAAVGAEFRHVVKLNNYLVDRAH